jgi:DNA (cytosine-5)-methyltransferase 1
MAIGARIDTRDVALIKKRLADAKLTLAEPLTAANRKAVADAVRRQAKACASTFPPFGR